MGKGLDGATLTNHPGYAGEHEWIAKGHASCKLCCDADLDARITCVMLV